MRIATMLLVVLIARGLAAHPLDDKADMLCEITLLDSAKFEIAVEFRYKDAWASYAEFANLLDRNNDGAVTRAELQMRFDELADQMVLALTVRIDGKVTPLAADTARFEFRGLDNQGNSVDTGNGMPVQSSRIFYRFVFGGGVDGLVPGDHQVEFVLGGAQTVVHTPALQMLPFDGRGVRTRIETAIWDTMFGGLPRVKFLWHVAAATDKKAPAENTAATPDTSTANGATEPTIPRGLGEVPAWLTLMSGVVVALCGLAIFCRKLLAKTRTSVAGPLWLIFAGTAIVLGALIRLGAIPTPTP